MKTICRHIVIRERDLVDIMVASARTGLWDRIDSEPLTYQGIQHENLMDVLKNPLAQPLSNRTLPNLYEAMLYKEPHLYNKNYLKWSFTMDYPQGQIYVQSRRDRPQEPLVRARLEKDL